MESQISGGIDRTAGSIIFLNRFFHPDHSATSQILGDLAFYLAEEGEPVHVIASRQRYNQPDANLAVTERTRSVQIHRVAATRFGRAWLIGRAIDYLSFYLSAGWTLVHLARREDVVVVKTDPPMLSIVVAAIARFKGFKVVNWLQDLYPEVAAELGVTLVRGRLGSALAVLRNRSLCAASLNVAIGEDMAKRLHAVGLPWENIEVIPNWTDNDSIVPIERAANLLRRQWSLDEKFVIAYSGNLGRAHDVETLLGAAEQLKPRTDIVFLFVGGGHGFVEINMEASRRGLSNLVFKPYQPRENLSQSLGVGDVHWLSLKAGLDGLILPSKFYGIAAAGRPIVVIGSRDGEFSRLITQFDCGFHVGLGQSGDLAHGLVSLADNERRCREQGLNARRMLDDRFAKSLALERWHAVLRSVADESRPFDGRIP